MCISLILFRKIILLGFNGSWESCVQKNDDPNLIIHKNYNPKKGMDIVAYRVTLRTQKGFSRFY